MSDKIPKKDKFGIYLKIENLCLEIISLLIESSLEIPENKIDHLREARIKIEVLKRLIRLTKEINIIQINKYVSLETDLQIISKMTNGWIKFLQKKSQ